MPKLKYVVDLIDQDRKHLLEVTERDAAVDFAHQFKWLVDRTYPHAEVICVVLDNLNTHNIASFYETFEPCEARRIAKRVEFRHTPKHGSWLDMAELEFSGFARQCLDRRNPDELTLKRECAALELERNSVHASVNWQFTSRDARTKLKSLYPHN